MGIELIAGPAAEPVSLAEAKAHLRVDTDDEDALIARLIAAARLCAEQHTGRAFLQQSWRFWRDSWPGNFVRALAIPRPPLLGVTQVAVYARSGAETVLSNDLYIVDGVSVPGRVVLEAGTVLPAPLREVNGVAISYDAGYGSEAEDVPAAIRAAILYWLTPFYESRGDDPVPPPRQAQALLAPYRVVGL